MRHAIKIAIMGLFLLLILQGVANAFRPPPFIDWTMEVGRGHYQFVMLATTDDPLFRNRSISEANLNDDIRLKYPKSGLYTSGDQPKAIWTIDWYAYRDRVLVASDGKLAIRQFIQHLDGSNKPHLEPYEFEMYENGKLIAKFATYDGISSEIHPNGTISVWRAKLNKAETIDLIAVAKNKDCLNTVCGI